MSIQFPAFLKLEVPSGDDAKSKFLRSIDDMVNRAGSRVAEFGARTDETFTDAFGLVRPKNQMQAQLDDMLRQMTSKIDVFKDSARRNLDAAFTGKVSVGGGFDLDVAGAREAAAVAERRAIVARQLADATRNAALAEKDFSQATRLSIAAAKELADSEMRAAATAKAQADSAARLQAELDRTGAAMRGLVAQNDNVVRATGAQRQGLQQLGYQLGDVATMYALGAKPAQIFASQIGQITQAVQSMSGGTSRLAAFLGGPWGIALSTAAIVVGPFIGQLYEMVTGADTARSALQKLIDKQREVNAGALDDTQAVIGLNKLRDQRLKVQTELDKLAPGKVQGAFGFSPVTLKKQLREINMQIAEAEGAIAATEARRADIERKSVPTKVEATKAIGAHGAATRATTVAIREQVQAVSELDKILAGMTQTLKAVQPVNLGDISKPYEAMLQKLGAGQSEPVRAAREAAQAVQDWNDRLFETVRLLDQIGGAGSALGGIGRALGALQSGNLSALPGPAGIIGSAIGGVTWHTVDQDGNRMVRQLGDEFSRVLDDVFGSKGSFAKVMESAGIGSAAGGLILGSGGNNLGSALGGVLGKEAGEALGKGVGGLLGKAAGPLGSIVGGVLGGALGGLLKSTKTGFSVISNRGVTSGGSSRELAQGAANTGDSIAAQLQSIADRLGGSVGNYAVSIGTRSSGYIRVSASGSSDVAGKNFYKSPDAIYDGKDPAEAARIALLNAIQDGAIQGVRSGAQQLLKAGKDVEQALQKALDFEGVFSALKGYRDPTGAALDTLDREFRRLQDIFMQAGASASEYANLEELYGIRRVEAVDKANDQILGSMRDLQKALTIGNSALSLRDRNSAALAAFNPLADRVRAGDTTAYDKFVTASQDLLNVQRELFGSTGAYFATQDQIAALTNKAIADQTSVDTASAGRESPFAQLASQQQATTSAIDAQTNALVEALENRLGLRLDTLNDNTIAVYQQLAANGTTGTILDMLPNNRGYF